MPSEPFVGEIFMAGYSFAPRGYAACNGQLLPISQNQALFSLLGTNYGGNGQTNFALPDLRGRVPIHQGQGPGLSTYDIGQVSGSETVTLTAKQMPAHVHALNASTAGGDKLSPAGNLIATDATGQVAFYKDGAVAPNTTMARTTIAHTGGSQPHTNLQPYLAINFYIALQGIFPARN